MTATHFVVKLDPAFEQIAQELLSDLLWEAPLSPGVRCLLCGDFDPLGNFSRLVAFHVGSFDSQTTVRRSTTLFLPHHAIALALQMDDLRIPFGFQDTEKNRDSTS